MTRSMQIKGLQKFTIGVLLLGATGLLCNLDLGSVVSTIFRIVYVLALILVYLGISGLAKADSKINIAKSLLVWALILAVLMGALPIFFSNNPQVAYGYIGLICGVGSMLLALATVYLVIDGCSNLACAAGEKEQEASCQKTMKIFITLEAVCVILITASVTLGQYLKGGVYLVAILAIVISLGAHILMGLRAMETEKLLGNRNTQAAA